MMNQLPQGRGQLIRVAIATGCVLLGTVVVVDHVALSNLKRDVAARTHDAETDHRLTGLEQRVEAIEHQPAWVSQASFDAAKKTLNDRLAKVERVIDGSVRMNDLAALQDRFRTLEARVLKALRTLAPSRQATAPIASTESEPPFTVLGIDLRGGERLLTLLPAGSHSLAEIRLLRVGETLGAWRLEALNGNTAEFRIDGRLQRIVAP